MIGYSLRQTPIGYVECYFDHPSFKWNCFQRPNYDTWLNQIVASYQTLLDGKDRTFSRFLLDLPAVPDDVLGLLRELCVDTGRCNEPFPIVVALLMTYPRQS